MSDTDVLTQTVLILELLLAVRAGSRWLRRVLGPNVPPQIDGRDHQIAVAALGPFRVFAACSITYYGQ